MATYTNVKDFGIDSSEDNGWVKMEDYKKLYNLSIKQKRELNRINKVLRMAFGYDANNFKTYPEFAKILFDDSCKREKKYYKYYQAFHNVGKEFGIFSDNFLCEKAYIDAVINAVKTRTEIINLIDCEKKMETNENKEIKDALNMV